MKALRVVVALAIVALPAIAAAQSPADLKRKADALFDEKRYEEAVTAYDEAYAASPNAAVLFNRGRALQFLARYPAALDSMERFEREATPEVRAKVPGLKELLADLRSHVATVTVRCDVKGARVLLGGKQIGECPIDAPVRVNAGQQTAEAFADGYSPFHRDVVLPGGATTPIEIVLVARDTAAVILVRSSVSGTRVSIDGTPLGVVPAEGTLKAGEHAVTAEHEGFDPATTHVVLRAGDRKELTLDPAERSGGVLGKWWFWTGVGVVVAAGVTTTVIALSTERSAPSGNFSPGQVKF